MTRPVAHHKPHCTSAGPNPHAAKAEDARANGVLEEWPRDGEPRHAAVAHGEPCAAEDPREVAKVVARLAAPGSELRDQPWKEPLECIDSASEQAVRVTALRDGRSWRGIIRKLRPFDQEDFFEVVRERPRGQESSDAGAEHDGCAMLAVCSCDERGTWPRSGS